MNAVIFTSAFLLTILPTPAIAQACIQATQRLQVPEQIHLVEACQVPPEITPKLSFLLSESGIDIYRVDWPLRKKAGPAQADEDSHPYYPLSVTALFVFQDEKERQLQIKSIMGAGEAIAWLRGGYRYDSTLPADWTPVFSIKYVMYKFTILGSNKPTASPKDGSNSVLLVEADMYAPEECYAYGTRCVNADKLDWESAPNFKSSEIATYNNRSPTPLPQGSLAYRAAMMLGKMRMQEAKSYKK